jgi:ABC-type transport system substrate-binding protein
VPALLDSWSSSENGSKWTYNLRHGVKWHDGYDFTADDVLFSLWALMNSNAGSQFVGYYQSVYGNKVKFTWENGTSKILGTGTREGNITALDQYTVEFWLPELALGKPYGYIDPYLLGFANNIIPKHIFEKIPVGQWTDTPFNTGQGSIVIPGVGTYTGPVGTGPYKWVSFDPVTQLVHLEKFTDYWNRTALEADGMFEVNDYYIKFIADKTSALAALKNGEVDMLDTNYQMQVDVPTIDPAWGKVLLQEGTGRQEIGYNMRHPIFGTGVDTPLGKANASRAAEAARYVRTAFDYAIPRQLIIDNLLAGFGQPAATPMLPTQPYYNASVTARPYDLAMARHYLELAGYTVPGPPAPPSVPSFVLGMSTTISGIYTDADGNPLAGRELQLMVTTNNATYNETSTWVGTYTIGLSGEYTFTVNPTSTGVFYYYLFDLVATAGTEWTYATMINVSSFQSAFNPLYDQINSLTDQIDALQGSVNNLMYVAVAAIVITMVIGAVVIFMARKKP